MWRDRKRDLRVERVTDEKKVLDERDHFQRVAARLDHENAVLKADLRVALAARELAEARAASERVRTLLRSDKEQIYDSEPVTPPLFPHPVDVPGMTWQWNGTGWVLSPLLTP